MSELAQAAAKVADPPPDFSSDSDAELFEWMALGDSSPTEAHAAFAEFHRRHAKYFWAQCFKRYKDEAEDILAETLRQVYETAAKFDRTILSDPKDVVTARRLVRAWVGRRVRWVAADHFAQQEKFPRLVTPDRITSMSDESCGIPEEDTTGFESELVVEVRKIVSEFSDREQAIAWEIAHSWHPGEGCLKWSTADLDAIGERYGLTRENIRQIKCRLSKKLRTKFAALVSGTLHKQVNHVQ